MIIKSQFSSKFIACHRVLCFIIIASSDVYVGCSALHCWCLLSDDVRGCAELGEWIRFLDSFMLQ